MTKKKLKTKKDNPHYVNNAEFSKAVWDYVMECKKAPQDDPPQIPQYIAECFLKIAQKLATKPKYSKSYKDSMISDAVYDCCKGVRNFNIDRKTRTGLPNAFSYFTTACCNAFLRRIIKEEKQQKLRQKLIDHASLEQYVTVDENCDYSPNSFIERARCMREKHFIDDVE